MIIKNLKPTMMFTFFLFLLIVNIVNSQIQMTNNSKYEGRGSDVMKASDGTYWLVFTRADVLEIRETENDLDNEYYTIYYKKAASLEGLASAQANLIMPSSTNRPLNFKQTEATVVKLNGKIWVFAIGSSSSSNRNLYAYTSTNNGDSWNGPETILQDSNGALHAEAVVDKSNQLWVFYQDMSSNLCYIKYNGSSWSSPLIIANKPPNRSIPKVWYDSENDDFFIVHCASGTDIYLTYSTNGGSDWTTTSNPIITTPESDWDPTIAYLDGKFYCYMAPIDGNRQYLVSTSTSSYPPISGWSQPAEAPWATGIYGNDQTNDFWPILLTDEGSLYVFYTSERNSSGTAKGSGNIWMFQAQGLTIEMDPLQSNIKEAETCSLNLVIKNVTNIGAFQLDIAYNTDVVIVNTASLGTFLGSSGRTVIPTNPVIDNTINPGKLTFGAATFGTTPGPDGNGVLATIVFQAQAAGTTTIELQNVQISDINGQLITINSTNNGEIVVSSVTEISEKIENKIPTAYQLHQNYPNPFNPETIISFSLPKEKQVELTIYNVLGQKIRNLICQSYQAGEHVIKWYGLDDSGEIVNSGIYVYKIKAGAFTDIRKMTFMK